MAAMRPKVCSALYLMQSVSVLERLVMGLVAEQILDNLDLGAKHVVFLLIVATVSTL
jgi:hypothetical protein